MKYSSKILVAVIYVYTITFTGVQCPPPVPAPRKSLSPNRFLPSIPSAEQKATDEGEEELWTTKESLFSQQGKKTSPSKPIPLPLFPHLLERTGKKATGGIYDIERRIEASSLDEPEEDPEEEPIFWTKAYSKEPAPRKNLSPKRFLPSISSGEQKAIEEAQEELWMPREQLLSQQGRKTSSSKPTPLPPIPQLLRRTGEQPPGGIYDVERRIEEISLNSPEDDPDEEPIFMTKEYPPEKPRAGRRGLPTLPVLSHGASGQATEAIYELERSIEAESPRLGYSSDAPTYIWDPVKERNVLVKRGKRRSPPVVVPTRHRGPPPLPPSLQSAEEQDILPPIFERRRGAEQQVKPGTSRSRMLPGKAAILKAGSAISEYSDPRIVKASDEYLKDLDRQYEEYLKEKERKMREELGY